MAKPLNPPMNRKMAAYGTSNVKTAPTTSSTKPKTGSGPTTATGGYTGKPKGAATGGKGKLFRDSTF